MTGAPSEVVFRRAQLNAQIRALLPGAVERVGGCKRAAEITGTTVRAARGWDQPSDHVPVFATFDL